MGYVEEMTNDMNALNNAKLKGINDVKMNNFLNKSDSGNTGWKERQEKEKIDYLMISPLRPSKNKYYETMIKE